ncbi:MAG: TIGR03905 family protein [Clostridiales bacterium]|nr:MAG: TIGR03905 family protein [Clostridiales bacterium]
MKHIYITKGTCSTKIEFDLDKDIVKNVIYTGGCSGNLQAIPRLVEGLTVEQVIQKCGGIKCGFKDTSCADQLAFAVQQAYQEENKE